MKALTLDKSKVRKGKPLGLPYIGSKRMVAKQLVEIIKQNFIKDGNTTVYDVFGGGGSITLECIVNDIPVVYNDRDKLVVDTLLHAITLPNEELPNYIISRDEFIDIKSKADKTPSDKLKLLINSFGNQCQTYIYAKQDADYKYTASKKLLASDDVSNVSGMKVDGLRLEGIQRLRSIQRLQGIERLRSIQRLQGVDSSLAKFVSKDYKELDIPSGSIIYLDPPYFGSRASHNYGAEVNHDEFYNWAVDKSKDNIVLVSSYEIADPRFSVVYEFPTARSKMQQGRHGTKYEKIFMVNGGLRELHGED